MMPTYITILLTVLIIVAVLGIMYGVKCDLESADLYKAEVDTDKKYK